MLPPKILVEGPLAIFKVHSIFGPHSMSKYKKNPTDSIHDFNCKGKGCVCMHVCACVYFK